MVERFAIMDDTGIIYEGAEDFIMPIWNKSDKLVSELSKDKKHKGDIKLIKILEVIH